MSDAYTSNGEFYMTEDEFRQSLENQLILARTIILPFALVVDKGGDSGSYPMCE